jgi:hypothetical protein
LSNAYIRRSCLLVVVPLTNPKIVCFTQNYNAKLSDFGLAKNGPTGGNSHVTTRVMGTYGYTAPEYVATGTHACLRRNQNESTEETETSILLVLFIRALVREERRVRLRRGAVGDADGPARDGHAPPRGPAQPGGLGQAFAG